LILALIFLGCATSSAAQEFPKSQSSPSRTIVLPPKMRAGDPATLGVLDAAGRMASGAVVELSTGQKVTTDATGRGLFVAPSEPGVLTAKILGQGTTVTAAVVASSTSATPITSTRPDDDTATRPDQDRVSYPRFLTLHDQFTIEGASFNGRADANHVFLAGQPCLITAASPLALVVLPGLRVPIGPIPLLVRANGRELGPFSVAVISIEFSTPTEGLTAGSQSKLVLLARGTTESLGVEVRNASPEIIQFLHGNAQRLKTSGGEQNIASVDIKSLAEGNYVVTAKLIPTRSGPPDIEAVREKLLDARKAASGSWTARVDHVIAQIDQSPEDIAQVRADLKQILDDKPIGPLAASLNSAWQELNP
jgi:hypothetical protein